MLELCFFGMVRDLKKFLGKCDPTQGLVFHHQMWNPPSVAFSEPKILA
jgi:hypothetical protein